jgi:hypothetical protein
MEDGAQISEGCPTDVEFTLMSISMACGFTGLIAFSHWWGQRQAEEDKQNNAKDALLPDHKDEPDSKSQSSMNQTMRSSFDSSNHMPMLASADFQESKFLARDCLANHPEFTSLELAAVCACLVASWTFFFWSHQDQYSTIQGDIRIGDVSQPVVLSAMGLAGSTCDFWAADVWFLGAGTFAACGLLPYLKINLLVYSLFAPRWILPVNTRKGILMAMDQINKLIIVINIAVVTIALAFSFEITGPLGEGNGLLDVDMYVTLGDGFFINIAATALVYTAGAFILFLHRAKEEPTMSLLAHLANNPHAMKDLEAPKATWFGGTFISQCVAFTMLACGMVLCIRGCFSDSFCIELGGFLGFAAGDGEQCYSVVGSLDILPSLVPVPEEFGIQFSRALLIFLAFVVPVFHMLMLVALYAAPLTVFRQHQLFYATEVIAAWACLDLFCCGVLANSFEFSKFADAISELVIDELPEAALGPVNMLGGILTLDCDMTWWFASLAFGVVCIHIMHFNIMKNAEELIASRVMGQYRQMKAAQPVTKGAEWSGVSKDNRGSETPIISLRELADGETDSWIAMNQ